MRFAREDATCPRSVERSLPPFGPWSPKIGSPERVAVRLGTSSSSCLPASFGCPFSGGRTRLAPDSCLARTSRPPPARDADPLPAAGLAGRTPFPAARPRARAGGSRLPPSAVLVVACRADLPSSAGRVRRSRLALQRPAVRRPGVSTLSRERRVRYPLQSGPLCTGTAVPASFLHSTILPVIQSTCCYVK